ncbi:MAG TPA: FixH family protein [Caulobacteraceae bacterium]|nr:FixH family protein [Caulobacteraceae bacterium]
MTAETQARSFRLNGWHVLAGFVLFFGVTLAVDTIMMVDAYRTYPGEAAASPYDEGLAFDNEIDQQARQRALGWRMTAGVTNAGALAVTVTAADGHPVSGLKLSGGLERPATADGRRALAFRETAPGAYQAQAAGLSGAWDLTLRAEDAKGRRFDAARRLVL